MTQNGGHCEALRRNGSGSLFLQESELGSCQQRLLASDPELSGVTGAYERYAELERTKKKKIFWRKKRKSCPNYD